jgi:hypothetical protein
MGSALRLRPVSSLKAMVTNTSHATCNVRCEEKDDGRKKGRRLMFCLTVPVGQSHERGVYLELLLLRAITQLKSVSLS